jgi:fatty acid desaturase
MWKYIGALFSLGFWFNLTAVPFLPWIDKALLILLTGLLLAGAALHVYIKKTSIPKDMRPVYVGATAWLVWAAVVGFLLYGFTWQRIPVLSMRLFWLFWLGGFGYWKYALWHAYKVEIPAARASAKEREAYEKWLPKPKH